MTDFYRDMLASELERYELAVDRLNEAEKGQVQEKIQGLRQRILAIETRGSGEDNGEAHVCRRCGISDADQGDRFVGFHAPLRGSGELCDDCAQFTGCSCCEI